MNLQKESSPIVNRLPLFLAILFQLTGCSPKQASPEQAIKSFPLEVKDTSLTLKFTSGVGPIFEDSKGNHWFGSHREGVCLFDGQSFTYFSTKEGLADNQIHSIQEDSNGNIWFGCARGISSFDGEKIINHIPQGNGEWEKTNNDLWFSASNQEGVYRFDGQQLNYLAFPNPTIINPNNVYFVTDLAKGKNDMLWIGTYAGIFGYDGDQFTIINDKTLGLNKETGLLHIRSILEDSKGRLWIGNNGIGVLLKEGDSTINFSEKHHLIHPTSSRAGDPSPPGTLEHVFAIEEDGNGNIWFSDRDTGVWKYDGNTIRSYTKELGLSNDFVLSIYKDHRDDLWFGLANGRVFKLSSSKSENE